MTQFKGSDCSQEISIKGSAGLSLEVRRVVVQSTIDPQEVAGEVKGLPHYPHIAYIGGGNILIVAAFRESHDTVHS